MQIAVLDRYRGVSAFPVRGVELHLADHAIPVMHQYQQAAGDAGISCCPSRSLHLHGLSWV